MDTSPNLAKMDPQSVFKGLGANLLVSSQMPIRNVNSLRAVELFKLLEKL